MKLLFISDIHGSTPVLKKALKSAVRYSVDLLIIGGDLCGKEFVTVTNINGNYYTLFPKGSEFKKEKIWSYKSFIEKIENKGSYIIEISETDYFKSIEDNEFADQFIEKVTTDRIKEWVKLIQKNNFNFKILFSPGNDDPYYIDEIFRQNEDSYLIYGVNENLKINDYQFFCFSPTNLTPWRTAREFDEVTLKSKAENILMGDNSNKYFDNYVFIMHCPPFESNLDEAPDVTNDFEFKIIGGQISKVHVGCKATRDLIEEYQPIISLHGHIHESPGEFEIGSTLCVNPGSEYAQGVMRGYFVEILNNRIIKHHRIEA